MTFLEEIEATLAEIKAINTEGFDNIRGFEQELSEKDVFELALRKGAKVPDFTLPNAFGKMVSIAEMYAQKPVVLVFYRGQWCPFCNIQLRSLQKNLSRIAGSPANLIAISPQTPDSSLTTKEKLGLEFEVLSDVDGRVGKLFNLIYTVPDFLHKTYQGFGIDIEQFNGKGKLELPYPATYIINREGIIVKDYISSFLNERLDTEEIIKFLNTL